MNDLIPKQIRGGSFWRTVFLLALISLCVTSALAQVQVQSQTTGADGETTMADRVNLFLRGVLLGLITAFVLQSFYSWIRIFFWGAGWGPDDIRNRSRLALWVGGGAQFLLVWCVLVYMDWSHWQNDNYLYDKFHNSLQTLNSGRIMWELWFGWLALLPVGIFLGQNMAQMCFRKARVVTFFAKLKQSAGAGR